MSKLPRRFFLTGRSEFGPVPASSAAVPVAVLPAPSAAVPVAVSPAPSAAVPVAVSPAPSAVLPSVISWLSEYMDGSEQTACVPLLPAKTFALHRPPGALEEREFLERCTRCGDCVSACPHDALSLLTVGHRSVLGTPSIQPSRAPCQLCVEFPCIEACGQSALVPDADAMGVAFLSRFDCLNSLGNECNVCVERCPVPGAITRQVKAPRVAGAGSVAILPLIHSAICVGCGVCEYACPAPVTALAILPNSSRRSGRSAAKATDA